MSEEKRNNAADWAVRLGKLDELPDEPVMDCSTSWEKLHARIDKGRESFLPYRYWLAAACIVLMFLTPFGIVHKNSSWRVKEDMGKDPGKSLGYAIPKKIPLHLKAAPAVIVLTKPKKIRKTGNHAIKYESVARDEPAVAPADIIPEIMYTDTASNVAAVVAHTPRKMRVIHINDLLYPVGEQQIMAENREKRSLGNKAAYRENLSRMRLGNNTTDNLIKINLSPTN